MDENFMERFDKIQDLHRMLDMVTEQKKEQIISGQEEVSDIIRHDNMQFNIIQNGQEVEVTKNVYEVLVEKNGELYHEFYDDQGNSLIAPISDKTFLEGKALLELGQGNFDEKSLIYQIYNDKDSKSLEQLEKEQANEIAESLNMDPETIKELDLSFVDTNQKAPTSNAQEELKKYMALGMVIDTNELATSDETIKEFLNTDATKLLAIKINDDWKILKVDAKGKLSVEKNLQISANSSPFKTIGNDGKPEIRQPEIEFVRKDNPDHSLAIDTLNEQNKTQMYLVAGNSRSASEIESTSASSPYAEARNNELLQKAQENPDKTHIYEPKRDNKVDEPDVDPHEPSLEPGQKPY